MPEFISKLQHKYYEKGEYTDEKARKPEEIIKLIKSFPWDKERGVDVQLTSPSVTIMDEYGKYLKAAVYYNGKFCLYFLDSDGHLYEQSVKEIKDVCDIVTDFLNGQLPLQNFEKHLFSIGSKSHFETAGFRYTVNSAAMLMSFLIMGLLCLFTVVVTAGIFFVKPTLWPLSILYFLLSLIAFQRTYFSLKIYQKTQNMFIDISSGSGTFELGTDNDYKTYNKSDIVKIVIYGGVKSSRMFGMTELVLTDGSSLFVPGMLISHFDLVVKFRDVKTEYSNGFFKQNEALRRAGR